MPALQELTQDDKDFLALANRPALEWFEKITQAEREAELGSLYGTPIREAAGSWSAAMQHAGRTVREWGRAYERISNRWGGEDFYRARIRDVDEGPFMTFAYDWIHGRMPVDPMLREVPWVNREMDARSMTCDLAFRDGSEFTVQMRGGDNTFGVFIGGPMDGQRVSQRDAEMIQGGMRDRAGGFQPYHFNFRTPQPINLARRIRDDELVSMPTFSTATYTAYVYEFPNFHSGVSGIVPFLAMRHQP